MPRASAAYGSADHAPGIVGTISVPLVVPDRANELSVQVVGSWFLPGEQLPDEFEARTDPQKL